MHNPSRRRSGPDAKFGFFIEQLFAMKSSAEVLQERGGAFATIRIPELVFTYEARNAPSL
ncbi:MAG: hypothetical protein K5905_22615 [Roseibium sp.]|uniref:hypothetical protein n=1 Tax=Roseibium sp. TaxID=1936156 RepID=UPI002625DEF8|nr:hypothetical protein [Roseibium sp.]MCV0428259.1 hypothetical protein [Roseibium sp.]